jgi:hypothetical protein
MRHSDTLEALAAAGIPRGRPLLQRRGPDPGLRQPDRLRGCQFRSLAGRGAGDCRRIRLRQDHAAQLHFLAADTDLRHGELPHARWCNADSTRWRSRAALPDAHRLGLRAPEPDRRPAHDGVGRRQCRRTADGGRRPALRQYPQHRDRLARPGRDRCDRIDDQPARLSRAACGSGCRSPATWSPARGWSSWTNPPAGSMSRCRRGCSICLRGLVSDLGPRRGVVTHDLAVARLLSHRMMVMKEGRVIESGLTDRVLDDPRAPYTQLLVSSILQV